MIATRKGGTAVKKDDKLAGMRVIPLIISSSKRKEVLLSLPVKNMVIVLKIVRPNQKNR